jgi:hypothetical protein
VNSICRYVSPEGRRCQRWKSAQWTPWCSEAHMKNDPSIVDWEKK